MTSGAPLLSIENLTVNYRQHGAEVSAVRGASLTLRAGETIGVVGESGCGKSTLALAVIGLLPKDESRIAGGRILFEGKNLLELDAEGWRRMRGARIAMIFQDPFSALNPVMTVENQLRETIELDRRDNSRRRAVELLEQVRLPDPERILRSYPHQLSGGQRQRVVIAIALARHPSLLIADEPTTALDVTVQDEIVKLLADLQKQIGMAMLFVTHNMGLVKGVSNELAVMYAGQIAEIGPTAAVLRSPMHPYTQGLLRSLPTLKKPAGPLPVLEGQPPEPRAIPAGCPFHPRCPKRFEPCDRQDPEPRAAGASRARCLLYK